MTMQCFVGQSDENVKLDRMSKMGLPYFIYSETVRAKIRHDGESSPGG